MKTGFDFKFLQGDMRRDVIKRLERGSCNGIGPRLLEAGSYVQYRETYLLIARRRGMPFSESGVQLTCKTGANP